MNSYKVFGLISIHEHEKLYHSYKFYRHCHVVHINVKAPNLSHLSCILARNKQTRSYKMKRFSQTVRQYEKARIIRSVHFQDMKADIAVFQIAKRELQTNRPGGLPSK